MIHSQYMSRCLQLAGLGAGYVAPNPMVGAVIVHRGRIIGEGYHRRFGEAHAEPNAIRSVTDKSLLREATLYVSLEPCSHHGKTPPCADLIVSCGIPRVVIGMTDPNPQVAGRGIRRLQEAGIEVIVGVLEAECRVLNRHFITMHEQHRPYITLKWAQTADGYIDLRRTSADTPPLALSNKLTRMFTHKLRAAHRAILVGGTTARLDRPSLTVRYWQGCNPVRIVIDRSGQTSADSPLCDGNVPTIIYTAHPRPGLHAAVEQVTTDFTRPDALHHILYNIYGHGIDSVLVEGGTFTLNEFIGHGLWDEAHIEVAPIHAGEGVPAPDMPGPPHSIKEYQGHRIISVNSYR